MSCMGFVMGTGTLMMHYKVQQRGMSVRAGIRVWDGYGATGVCESDDTGTKRRSSINWTVTHATRRTQPPIPPFTGARPMNRVLAHRKSTRFIPFDFSAWYNAAVGCRLQRTW